jgi:hypothetical protein
MQLSTVCPLSDEDIIKKLKINGLKVTVKNTLSDYLSCKIMFLKDKKKAWLGQLHLLKTLGEKKIGETVNKFWRYLMPGTLGVGIQRPKTEEEKISEKEQSVYQMGVGMILYLVEHSRPDIVEGVRKISQSVDGATYALLKAMT